MSTITFPLSSEPTIGASSPSKSSWWGRHKVTVLTGLGVGGVVLLVAAIAAFTIFAFPVAAAAFGTTALIATAIPLSAKITVLVGLTIAAVTLSVSVVAYRQFALEEKTYLKPQSPVIADLADDEISHAECLGGCCDLLCNLFVALLEMAN